MDTASLVAENTRPRPPLPENWHAKDTSPAYPCPAVDNRKLSARDVALEAALDRFYGEVA